MPSMYINYQDWCQSKKRSIDDETLCDFLRIIEYKSEREQVLEEIGIEDNGSPEEALFVYVLDALNVPEQGHVKFFPDGETGEQVEHQFDRSYFEEIFYSEFLLNNKENQWDYIDVINKIREEVREDLNNHYVLPR